MSQEILVQVLGPIASAAALYAAIRADLREALTRATLAQQSADKAHHRLDSILHHSKE